MATRLAEAGLVRGKTIGIDATTLEANAAMRSLVRRDTGQDYETFVKEPAKSSGVPTPADTDKKGTVTLLCDRHQSNVAVTDEDPESHPCL